MRRKITSACHGWLPVRTDQPAPRSSRRKSFIYIEMDLERSEWPTENLHTPANELNLISEKRDKYFHPTYHCEHKSNPISCSDFFPSVFLRLGSHYLHTPGQDEVRALVCTTPFKDSRTDGQTDHSLVTAPWDTRSRATPPSAGPLFLARALGRPNNEQKPDSRVHLCSYLRWLITIAFLSNSYNYLSDFPQF